MRLIRLSTANFLALFLVSDEETHNYLDVRYGDIDSTYPSTSRGNGPTMEAIKTTENPYYCGDNVQLGEKLSGNTKREIK